MRNVLALVVLCFGIAKIAEAAIHEYPCVHVCNSPSCIAANIEAWESANSAGCANVDFNSATATHTYVTDCARIDLVGSKRQARTVLTCSSGSCSLTGTFKCPSASGFKITQSFSIACPQRNGHTPDAYISETQYGYGIGTYAQCTWPDGHYLQVRCNEQDGSTTVWVNEN